MALKLAILPNTRALVVESAASENHEGLIRLGFRKRESGAWVKSISGSFSPYQFQSQFPRAKLREMDDAEYILVATAAASSPEAVTKVDIPEPVMLGYNRQGQKVFDEDGRRLVEDSKGRRIKEADMGASVPGMFLRAVDDASLSMCAEGFIETVIHGKGQPWSSAEAYMKVAGVTDAARFRESVAAAVTRLLVRKGGASLRDRYGRALDIRKALGDFGLPDQAKRSDEAFVIRRLFGMDRDMIGAAVGWDPVGGEIMSAMVPKAVRLAEGAHDADFFAGFPRDRSGFVSLVERRPEGSMTAAFVEVPDEGGARATIEAIVPYGRIEAAAVVKGEPSRLVVSFYRDGQPGDPVEPVVLEEGGDLWSWASVTATERSRSIDAAKSGLGTTADFNVADGSRNSHQVPYAAASKAGKPTTMVPRELDSASRQALDSLVSAWGDIDDRVAVECGLPRGRIGDFLSPEQVDGIALAIRAEERGRGFLFADATGVGKGRPIMALAKRAVMRGQRVLVLTEKDSNLGDLMRDVKHLGALDVIKPAVMNRGVDLIDEDTDQPFEVKDQESLHDAVARGEWPSDVDVIFATYSQFNRPEQDSARAAWLASAVDEGVVVIADEVHNAASGDSNTSANVAVALDRAGSVVLSSATYAASAKATAFFKRLFPEGLGADEIAAMMRKGGVEFAEVVSAMLVADGVMVRRERDLSRLSVSQFIDTDRLQRNREYMDSLAAVIGEMAMLSGELDAAATRHNRDARNALKGLQMKRVSFGSPLHTMTRLFMASLLVDLAAERAIKALEDGKKPVVLVENTVQKVLEEAAASGTGVPDFRAVVHRILDQLVNVTIVDGDGNVERGDVGPQFEGPVQRIRRMIDNLPVLPASAIDEVKARVEAAGYSIGEITGRTLEVRGGVIVPRKGPDRTNTKNAFNSGRLDALIVNAAGSTGIDLHAGSRFKDQRPRVMIELQGPSHVVKQIQAYGRISRFDEVVPSSIELLSSGLPAETRLAAMRNQRLRRLSANVTSNRDSSFLARNIPDLINSVGDTVVARYAEMRPDLVKRLCLDTVREDAEAVPGEETDIPETLQDSDRSANEFLSRLMLLPAEHQEKVLQELVAEYEMHVAELEARGENPLRPRELEGIVHVRGQRLFEGTLSGAATSAFDGPMHILDVDIERVADPLRADTVMEEVEKGAAGYGRVRRAAQDVVGRRDDYLSPFLPKNARTVDEAIAAGNARIRRMAAGMQEVVTALDAMAPGRVLELERMDGEPEHAVICAIHAPGEGYEHLASMYTVVLAIPGATKLHSFRLDTLLRYQGVAARDENGVLSVRVQEGLEGADYDGVLDRFENAVGRKYTRGRILVTNIFRAVRLATQYGAGSLVSFVDSEGLRHRGVLVKKNFERKIEDMALRFDGTDSTLRALLTFGAEVSASPIQSKTAMTISPLGDSCWSLRLQNPPRRGGELRWPSEAYRALYESGSMGEDSRPRLRIEGEDELRSILETLAEAGFNAWFASSKHRGKMDQIPSQGYAP